MVKLSIVIPYYKTYNLTCKLLDKLIPQLTNEVEVFLVDDGCNETRLDKYVDINIIHLEKKGGSTIAMNTAFKQAVGKYNAIIDSDDMIDKDYIETLLQTIDERDEDVIYFDWQDMGNGVIVHHPSNYAPWKAIYKKEIMPLFREGWMYSYDVPFQEDLANIKHTKYYIDKVLYYYNSTRPDNLTHQKEQIAREGNKIENGHKIILRKDGMKMVKCKTIMEFTLKDFDKLKNIVRVNREEVGRLFVGDVFECDKQTADYLTGNNQLKKSVVVIIEVEPEEVEEQKDEVKIEAKNDSETIKEEITKPKKKNYYKSKKKVD